jgi:hypothetical protein
MFAYKIHNSKIFIWQAIVNGLLFLQRAFFFEMLKDLSYTRKKYVDRRHYISTVYGLHLT